VPIAFVGRDDGGGGVEGAAAAAATPDDDVPLSAALSQASDTVWGFGDDFAEDE
jgi:hypothetical protein